MINGITPEQARAELQKRGVSMDSAQPSITPEVARAELQRRGVATDQPEPTLGARIGKGIAGLGVGTIQGLADMGYGLADLGDRGINALTQKLFGKDFHLTAPKGDVYFGPAESLKGTLPAKAGELLGTGIGTALGGETFGARSLVPKALAYGASAAATQPGGLVSRGIAGALGTAGGATEHMLANLPSMFTKGMARKLAKLYATQKSIGKTLYTDAFKGTENIKPKISYPTYKSLEDLLEAWPTKSSPARKALNRFNKDSSIENMHILKSDLNKLQSKFTDKALKSGLSGNDLDRLENLNDVSQNLSNDLETSMKSSPTENFNKYQMAQNHWKENVIPFRKFSSIRKLLGPEKEVSPTLYTDLSKNSVGANKLRELLKTDLGTMRLSRILHKKVLGLPLPAYLSLGGGYGLYHLKNLKGE